MIFGTTALPILYSFRRCPYAMRARLAVAASGTPLELREVVLRNKPAALLAASAKATVPVLVLPDGSVIDESLEIMQWALRRHDPWHWLVSERGSLTDMLALVAGNDGGFKKNLDRYKYPHRYAHESGGDTTALMQAHRAQGALWLGGLESMLDAGYLFGGAASLADMALLPFVRQFAHTDVNWFAARPWPRVQTWLMQFEASALYVRVMEKQAPWQPAP